MINEILYFFQRPEKGWDPISTPYAKDYALNVLPRVNVEEIVQEVLKFTGDLKDKSVLDLGAGPGYFVEKFFFLGANVTWQDISHYHLKLFQKLFSEVKTNIQIGYMEEATGEYDLVFNRVCWYYCINDQKFVRKIIELLKPGGKAYLIIPNEGHQKRAEKQIFGVKGFLIRLRYYLNNKFGFKIGHPYLSTDRIKKIFSNLQCSFVDFDVFEDVVVVKLIK